MKKPNPNNVSLNDRLKASLAMQWMLESMSDAWIHSKKSQGITSRLSEFNEELMVPYIALSERAKELDRATVRAVYDAIELSITPKADNNPQAPTSTDAPAQPQRMTARNLIDRQDHRTRLRLPSGIIFLELAAIGETAQSHLERWLDIVIGDVMSQPPDAATKEMIVREWIESLDKDAVESACHRWNYTRTNQGADVRAFKDSLLAPFNQTVTT